MHQEKWTENEEAREQAATPRGELPSDGKWWVLLRLSNGKELKKNHSEVYTDDNQRTTSISTTGVANSIHPEMPRNNRISDKISITGYGTGFRVKPSKTEDALLLP